MDKLILADLQTLAASPDYGGRGFLQPSSAVLGLSAALFLSNLTLWQGAGYKLTDGEIDDIQAMIAQLEEDLMVTGAMYPQYKVKATNSSNLSIPHSTWTSLLLDTSVYDPEDMHNPLSGQQRLTIRSDGYYLISATLTWAQNSVGRRDMYLKKYDNALDTDIVVMHSIDSAVAGNQEMTQHIIFQDNSSVLDYYYLLVNQFSGSSLNIIGGEDYLNFAAVRL